jgi:hypothetical protein
LAETSRISYFAVCRIAFKFWWFLAANFTEYSDNIRAVDIYILCLKHGSDEKVEIAFLDTWEFKSLAWKHGETE